MSEVQVTKGQSNPRREASEIIRFGEGSFPFSRLLDISPFGLMREFTNEMDRVFHGWGDGGTRHSWSPAIDVHQSNGNLVVLADLPGLKREELKVELIDDALIIEGERKREHRDEHEGLLRRERSYGRFYRSWSLPQGAKADQAKAELKDGLLRVSIPVPDTRQKVRQIPIEEGMKVPSATM